MVDEVWVLYHREKGMAYTKHAALSGMPTTWSTGSISSACHEVVRCPEKAEP
jgi:hypothetical protein